MSMTRDQIRQLAEFTDNNSCAGSFYFQPSTPRNKAHKEDTILIKDLRARRRMYCRNMNCLRRFPALNSSSTAIFI